jgi:hypothetical protein
MLLGLAEAVHARRCDLARERGETEPSLEESVFAVQLASAALLGDALLGPLLHRSAGLASDDAAARERFRVWLGKRVVELLLSRHPHGEEPVLREPADRPEG